MNNITVIVEKGSGEKNFGCFNVEDIDKMSITGVGSSARAAILDFNDAYHEACECLREEGKPIPEVHFTYKFDVGSFFDYYPLNVTAVAKYIGINSSLLRQYASGLRVPQAKQLQKIQEGINTIIHDISSGNNLIDKPVLQYV